LLFNCLPLFGCGVQSLGRELNRGAVIKT
jgi:hypothetical protein